MHRASTLDASRVRVAEEQTEHTAARMLVPGFFVGLTAFRLAKRLHIVPG